MSGRQHRQRLGVSTALLIWLVIPVWQKTLPAVQAGGRVHESSEVLTAFICAACTCFFLPFFLSFFLLSRLLVVVDVLSFIIAAA